MTSTRHSCIEQRDLYDKKKKLKKKLQMLYLLLDLMVSLDYDICICTNKEINPFIYH